MLSSGVDGEFGSAFQHGIAVGRTRQDFEQAGAGVQAVIEAVPALLEEGVAGHLAGQRGAGFLELGLDQRVAGVPHQRHAAVLFDPRGQQAGAFDVVNDLAAGHARQHVGGEQHQLAVG
jgi:hypothetical protein